MERTAIVKKLLNTAKEYAEKMEETNYENMGELVKIAKEIKKESETIGINERLLLEEERRTLEWLRVYAEVIEKLR